MDQFDNCPRQYHWKYILKNKEPETPQMLEGKVVHEALEKRVCSGKALPAPMAKYDPMAQSIIALAARADGEIRTEMKVAVNRELKRTDFFAKDVYGRGALDLAVMLPSTNPKSVFIGDWKTGKPREKEFQVKTFAFFIFSLYPSVEKISACNLWLQTLKPGTLYQFDRADQPRIWSEISMKLAAMEIAARADLWPARQSPLCGWCHNLDCEFNPKRNTA